MLGQRGEKTLSFQNIHPFMRYDITVLEGKRMYKSQLRRDDIDSLCLSFYYSWFAVRIIIV